MSLNPELLSQQIIRATTDRVTDHHLELLLHAAERAMINRESKLDISPPELLALLGEILERRTKERMQ